MSSNLTFRLFLCNLVIIGEEYSPKQCVRWWATQAWRVTAQCTKVPRTSTSGRLGSVRDLCLALWLVIVIDQNNHRNLINRYIFCYHVIRSVPHLRASSAGSSTTSGSSFNQDTVCDLLNLGARRFGDRYWYENSGWPSSFTIEQVVETEKYCVWNLNCSWTKSEKWSCLLYSVTTETTSTACRWSDLWS